MKKKLLVGCSLIVLSFVLVGCGESSKNIDESNLQFVNRIIEDNENVEDSNLEADLDDLNLYSDDTKIVYNYNNQYNIVYYYEDTKITGLEWYYIYNTLEEAIYAKATMENIMVDDDSIKDVAQNNKYVIVKFNESEYKDMSVEDVKMAYAFLEEVKNK